LGRVFPVRLSLSKFVSKEHPLSPSTVVEEAVKPILSEQSLELINALQIAPRASWSRLADVLGNKPSTLSQRWNELQTRGLAWITAMVSGATRRSAIAFVEVGCQMERQKALGAEFVTSPNIVSVERLTQGPNFGLTVV